MKYETVVVGALETNCYLVYCEKTRDCIVVDPGAEPERIFKAIMQKKVKPVAIINTHGHIDHIGANRDIKERFDIPLIIHSADSNMLISSVQSEMSFFLGAKDSPLPDKLIEDGEIITVGNSNMRVIHTPGHSPGSISLLGEGFILSGDSLFFGGVGRTDLPGSSWEELVRSIKEKILVLPDKMIVLPGHGPHTTVEQEKNSNPFVS